MEAGLEHLSRAGGTLAHADVLLVVVEPSRKSVATATRTAELAGELGIPRVLALGNKARDDMDAEFLRDACAQGGLTLAGVLPYVDQVARADRDGTPVDAIPDELIASVGELLEVLDGAGAPS